MPHLTARPPSTLLPLPPPQDLTEYLLGTTDRSEHIQLPDLAAEPQQPAKRPRLDGGEAEAGDEDGEEAAEQSALRSILANEMQLRDRGSMLVIPGRAFDGVLDVLRGVQREQEREREEHKAKAHKQQHHQLHHPHLQHPRH